MELRLQKFIESMKTLSDIRNLDPLNPVLFQLEHPVTAALFTVIAAITEPSYMGIPINTTWVVLNPNSKYYLKALKLISWEDPADGSGYTQTWREINTYDEIFSDPQYYNSGFIKGDKGDKGDPGPAGPAGVCVVDYDSIISTVVSMLLAPKSLSLTSSTNTIFSGQTAQLTALVTYTDEISQAAQPVYTLSDPSAATIDANGLLTAGSVLADTTVTITASYTKNNVTVTATKDIVISKVTAVGLSIVGPSSVNMGSTDSYQAKVTYNDGSTSIISGAAWSLSNAALGAINSSGVLTAAGVTADLSGSVDASYVPAGATSPLTASLSITVKYVALTPAPYYGVAPVTSVKDANLTLGLSGRGPNASRVCTFTLDSGAVGSGLTMFYAYPTSYGQAVFTDTSNGFQGGWDGAQGDPMSLPGPITIQVNVGGQMVDFYLYQTDYPSLGQVTWAVS